MEHLKCFGLRVYAMEHLKGFGVRVYARESLQIYVIMGSLHPPRTPLPQEEKPPTMVYLGLVCGEGV